MPYILFFAAMVMPAQAYIDPNTGGLIMQILTPLLLMVGVAWAAFRRKMSSIKDIVFSYLKRAAGKLNENKK
jgi:hypothetical protein